MRLLLAALVLTIAAPTALADPEAPPSVLMVETKNGTVVHAVNGAPTSPAALLDAVSKISDKNQLVLLIQNDIPIQSLSQLHGLVTKAGFSDVSCFVFDTSKSYMQRVRFKRDLLSFSPTDPGASTVVSPPRSPGEGDYWC